MMMMAWEAEGMGTTAVGEGASSGRQKSSTYAPDLGSSSMYRRAVHRTSRLPRKLTLCTGLHIGMKHFPRAQVICFI